jgi:ribonucleotide reductase alpha subunit
MVLALKSPKTETAKRINDLKHVIKFNGFIYDLIEKDEIMYLFSPRKHKELYDNFHDNEKFEELYKKGIKEKLYSGSIRARELAEKFIEARVENGVYYIFNADHVNNNSPYKDVITQTNLCCVTFDTKILTRKHGYIEIGKVLDTEQECWNGQEWSMTKIAQTSESSKVYKVVLDNGSEIEATDYHKWYLGMKAEIVTTSELKAGDVLMPWSLPDGSLVGDIKVVDIIEQDKYVPTACGTEPKLNRLMFNGVLTGNCEFLSPTKPLSSQQTHSPDIGICILAGVNIAKNGAKTKLKDTMKVLVYSLNEIIHRQKQPTPQADSFVKNYAALGIGANSLAHFLADRYMKYGTEESLMIVSEYFEYMQYYGLMASMNYAKEFDACIPMFHKTKYSRGIMPHERTGKKSESELDWCWLKNEIIANGLANATITMHMPGETSSRIGNMTSGLDPIRKPLTIKDSKTSILKQYAPDCIALADKYDYAYDTKDLTERYIKTVAEVQKWCDQSQSLNTFYNKELYSDGKIPMSQIWGDIKLVHKLDIKTIYYSNIHIEDVEQQAKEDCVGCTL